MLEPCWASTASAVASNESDVNSSEHSLISITMSIGILDKLFASTFSLRGRHLIAKWKLASSANHLHPVAFSLAIDKT